MRDTHRVVDGVKGPSKGLKWCGRFWLGLIGRLAGDRGQGDT